ncbi:MAG TPA: DUF1697 domain-containing protein [Solirubrobacteraceae bacterium]|nr:DUF1697 domain-containing protein [Solirubrobacteraceae bacterium]
MRRYAAFLRGMNLGGRRITNADLCGHVAALGFGDVWSFRASGNLVVDAHGEDAADEVARRIEEGLATALGYPVPTYARSAAQLRAMASHEPFSPEQLAASTGKLQVALLVDAPSAAQIAEALAFATDDDRLAIHERELYWLPCGRMSDSGLDLRGLERVLGPTTIRTKGTINLITAKFFGD